MSSTCTLADLVAADQEKMIQLVRTAQRVAVLGIKDSDKPEHPAYIVPKYLLAAGLEVIPVPVLYPEATTILGQQIYRRVQDISGPIDIVNIFLRPEKVSDHLDDLIKAKPCAVWFQSGTYNEMVATELEVAGIMVVYGRCLMVEHAHYGRR